MAKVEAPPGGPLGCVETCVGDAQAMRCGAVKCILLFMRVPSVRAYAHAGFEAAGVAHACSFAAPEFTGAASASAWFQRRL